MATYINAILGDKPNNHVAQVLLLSFLGAHPFCCCILVVIESKDVDTCTLWLLAQLSAWLEVHHVAVPTSDLIASL